MLFLKFVYNVKTALATDNFVVRTNLLYTCTYFHTDHSPFLVVNDTLLILI
jgi:hypothetical protein